MKKACRFALSFVAIAIAANDAGISGEVAEALDIARKASVRDSE